MTEYMRTKLSYYENILRNLRKTLEKYNEIGDIIVPRNISREYDFDQISQTIIKDYIFIYVVYRLTENDYLEFEIILDGENSGYVFNYFEHEVVKLENFKPVNYKSVSVDFHLKFSELIESVIGEGNRNLVDNVYKMLDDCF